MNNAPRCGHCKRLAPEYEKAAAQLAENDPPIVLAAVDADAEKELGSQYGVQGFPTLKIFRKGRVFDYTGDRQSSNGMFKNLVRSCRTPNPGISISR